MIGSAKAHYEGIKAFSRNTDQTDDLKEAITVPVLVLQGDDDDQVVPIKMPPFCRISCHANSELKIYPGFPHGMHTTHANAINADILTLFAHKDDDYP